MSTTPWPTRIVDVRAATKLRKISGALMCAYHFSEWCSGAQMRSKPTCSANTAASTQSRSSRCSRVGDGSASCAPNPIAKSMGSSVPENQCAAAAAHHCMLHVGYLVGRGAAHLPDGLEHEVHA